MLWLGRGRGRLQGLHQDGGSGERWRRPHLALEQEVQAQEAIPRMLQLVHGLV